MRSGRDAHTFAELSSQPTFGIHTTIGLAEDFALEPDPKAPPPPAPPPDFMAETMRLAEFAKRYKISLSTASDPARPRPSRQSADAQHPKRTPLSSMKIGRERLVHLPTADA